MTKEVELSKTEAIHMHKLISVDSFREKKLIMEKRVSVHTSLISNHKRKHTGALKVYSRRIKRANQESG